MPELGPIDALVAAVSAILGGATAHVVKPRPGSPADHEDRLSRLERSAKECDDQLERTGERLAGLEDRMRTTDERVVSALARLSESQERSWNAIERILDELKETRETMIRVDTRTAIEAEERARSARKDK